jgi:hypothetical protein
MESDDILVVEHFHDFNLTQNLLQAVVVQTDFVDDLYGNLSKKKKECVF